jgi:hypothetical protein
LGQGPNDRSKRERKEVNYKELRVYTCSRGENQIPPGVRCYTVKHKRYRKIMSSWHSLGDKMFARAKVDVSSVESLVASPLSKLIQFAAHDCGYAGKRYELIANWVHPLCLKAKAEASKSDNPNWKKTTNDPFREESWSAVCKELEALKEMNDWEVVDRTDNTTFIDSICAFKLK